MNLLRDIETRTTDKKNGINLIRVIVEIPIGSEVKYELDPSGSYMTAVRLMNKKYKYIYSYGCLPKTLSGDNDPLDAIIICDSYFSPGTVLSCIPIGIVLTEDQGEEDDKVLCIPSFCIPKKINIKKILKYLNHYKYPFQKGTYIKRVLGVDEANKAIELAIENFKEKYSNEVSK